MISPAMHPAGFWQRYAAWSLDAAIVGIPAIALAWSRTHSALREVPRAFDALAARMAALMIDGLRSTQEPLSMMLGWLHAGALYTESLALQAALWHALQPGLTAFVLFAAIYWVAFERSAWRATPGKRALGLVVTDIEQQPLSLRRALARHVAGAASWLTLNLGHALAAVPPQKRALHDHLAGTRVLQVEGEPRLPAWARGWLGLQLVAAFAWIACLTLAMQSALQLAVENAL
jgi:uncharacterized RDD family membrane protein YckC